MRRSKPSPCCKPSRRGHTCPPAAPTYPRARLGESLKQIAQLIKADVGVEMAFADVGGWDHHVNEPVQLSNMLRDYGQALSAFWTDLGDRMADVVRGHDVGVRPHRA